MRYTFEREDSRTRDTPRPHIIIMLGKKLAVMNSSGKLCADRHNLRILFEPECKVRVVSWKCVLFVPHRI